MIDLNKYLSGEWLEGGRAWPQVDCYGLVLEVRRDLGLEEWPEWGAARRGDGMHEAGEEFTSGRGPCDPEQGAVALCYLGSLLSHVGVVVMVDGMLQVLECNSRRHVSLTPMSRFRRRFVRVEFYR